MECLPSGRSSVRRVFHLVRILSMKGRESIVESLAIYITLATANREALQMAATLDDRFRIDERAWYEEAGNIGRLIQWGGQDRNGNICQLSVRPSLMNVEDAPAEPRAQSARHTYKTQQRCYTVMRVRIGRNENIREEWLGSYRTVKEANRIAMRTGCDYGGRKDLIAKDGYDASFSRNGCFEWSFEHEKEMFRCFVQKERRTADSRFEVYDDEEEGDEDSDDGVEHTSR